VSSVTVTTVGWIQDPRSAETSWLPSESLVRPQPVAEVAAPVVEETIEEIPAFGVMLHLLAAVALGLASAVCGVLVLLDVFTTGHVVGPLALAGLVGSGAWLVRLVQVALRD
jgi:hypothetical protein